MHGNEVIFADRRGLKDENLGKNSHFEKKNIFMKLSLSQNLVPKKDSLEIIN